MIFHHWIRVLPHGTPLEDVKIIGGERARERERQEKKRPLQSPLLGESWLVSFPPLNYMLKFSGLSCLIWDPKKRLFSKQRIENHFTPQENTSPQKKNKLHITLQNKNSSTIWQTLIPERKFAWLHVLRMPQRKKEVI